MSFMAKQPKVLNSSDKNENVLLGVIGAFLFSLAGALCWIGLYYVNILAGISGFIGISCAILGYRLLGGKLTKKGVIIAVIFAFISIAFGWYMCLTIDIHNAFESWYEYGEVSRVPTLFECFTLGPDFLKEPEIARGYFKDLIIGMLLAIIGAISYIIRSFKTINNPGNVQTQQQSVSQFDSFDYDENGMPKRIENDGAKDVPHEDQSE